MDWYKEYKLVKDGDGYSIEILLNDELTEFSSEFLENYKKNLLELDENIRNLVSENFSNIKVNSVKLMVGTMIVASIPFAAVIPTPVVASATTQTDVTTLNTTGIVTASQLNMRTGPSTSYSVIHVLWKGNTVKVIGQSGSWYKIQLSDGRTGWVNSAYLQLNLRQEKINIVISTAKSLIGTPYVWGGESLSEGGFDCSGFTQYVFAKAGYQFNRISTEQAKQGISVSRSDLQPGDLVFFGFNLNGVVNHVGIYIGNGQMIHSPKTGDYVKATDITTSYWTTRFITARRII